MFCICNRSDQKFIGLFLRPRFVQSTERLLVIRLIGIVCWLMYTISLNQFDCLPPILFLLILDSFLLFISGPSASEMFLIACTAPDCVHGFWSLKCHLLQICSISCRYRIWVSLKSEDERKSFNQPYPEVSSFVYYVCYQMWRECIPKNCTALIDFGS